MSKQYNTREKRKRRTSWIRRKRVAAKSAKKGRSTIKIPVITDRKV